MRLFRNIDLTVGNPFRQILLYSLPMLAGGLVQNLYSTADMISVGRYCGVVPYSAIGSTGSILFFYFGLLMGLSGGAGVITAQKFGARDEEAMRKSVAKSLLLAAGFTLLFTAVFTPLAGPILKAMLVPDDLLRDARTYLVILFAGTAAAALNNTAFSQSRAVGDSITPLLCLGASAVLNIVLNLLFVAVFHWGVSGVALATVLVSLSSGVGCSLAIWRKYPAMRLRAKDFRGGGRILLAQMRVGIPMGLQFLITAAGILVRQSATNRLGTEPLAGYATGARIESLITLPLFITGLVCATYAAQNLGAGRMDRVVAGIRACMRALVGYGIVVGAASLLFSVPVTRLFLSSPSEAVTGYVFQYLLVTVPFYVFLSAILVYRNALQGLDRPLVPFLGGVLELVSRGAFAFPFVAWFGFRGVVATDSLAWITAGILDYLYYRHVIRRWSVG